MTESEARVLGGEDAMMTDSNEKGRPPGDPPDGTVSWAARVKGTSVGGRPTAEMVLDEGFVTEKLSVEFPNGADGEPVITIGEEVLMAMNGLWKQCIIVKVLGRNVPVAVVTRKLRELWKPQGTMFVMDLPRQFFLVRFGEEEEYLTALTGGPWKAFGSYLMVRARAPDFDPLRDEINTTPVWVRLSNIPVNFYHKAILMGIAKSLGKPLRVDATTLNLERARFARICVEVDLKRPLKGSVLINGERYYVSYEGLEQICSQCGIYGHMIHSCPKGKPVNELSAIVQGEAAKDNEPSNVGNGFTEVRRQGRRAGQPVNQFAFGAGGSRRDHGRQLREIPKNKGTGDIVISNSFGRLEEDLTRVERREVEMNKEGNKENKEVEDSNILPENIPRVNGGEVGPSWVKKRNGAKGSSKDKTALALKPMEGNGPRTRSKNMGPTRGLVFGPVTSEVGLSSSGKRLRVEREDMGRAGGVFAREGNELMEEIPNMTGQKEKIERRGSDMVENPRQEDQRHEPNPVDGGMELVVA